MNLKKHIQAKSSRQTVFLFFSQIFSMSINMVSGLFIAKKMGSFQFGIYSFAVSLISFVAIFFEFGYFSSISRALTQSKDHNRERELLGVASLILIIISFLFVLTIFTISCFVDFVFKDKIGNILLIASVFSWGYILPFFMELILKGSNHIEHLAIHNITWKIFYSIMVFCYYIYFSMTLVSLLLITTITCIIPACFIIVSLKPSFLRLKKNLYLVQRENKSFGFHIYSGRVIDVSAFQLDKLVIGYFIGAREVGQYNISNSMANPINSFSIALTSSKFKELANKSEIPASLFRLNLSWIILAILSANFLGFIIIKFYLKGEYYDVQLLLSLMSIAVALQAAYQPYNAWLSGHGFGREMKSLNFKMAFFTLLLTFSLIPFFGSIGACIASILSNAYSLFLYVRLYGKSIRL